MMMRRQTTYLFSLWTATLAMLLSTVVLHHHHFDRICFVEERCEMDGNVNDEHTEHHENEQEGCQIHQMHHFLINAKVAKSIQKHIFDGNSLLVAVLPSFYELQPSCGLVVTEWQEQTVPLTLRALGEPNRRGPPFCS